MADGTSAVPGSYDLICGRPGSAHDPVLFEFTNDVTNDQNAEIERMNALLVGLSADPRAGLQVIAQAVPHPVRYRAPVFVSVRPGSRPVRRRHLRSGQSLPGC